MFIVWGEKRTEKSLGHAADFCLMCRDVQAFRVYRIGSASHVYGLSVGGGGLVGYLATCQTCGHKMEVDPTCYATLVKRRPERIEELERETYPGVREAYASRIDLEKSIADGRLDMPEDMRVELIREPFTSLASVVEQRYSSSSHFDRHAVLALLGALVVPGIFMFIASSSQNADLKGILGTAALTAFAAGLVLMFFFLITEARRFVRRTIVPKLARTLRSLKPERQELEECVTQLRGLGLKLAKKIKVDELIFLIEAPEAFRDRASRRDRDKLDQEKLRATGSSV